MVFFSDRYQCFGSGFSMLLSTRYPQSREVLGSQRSHLLQNIVNCIGIQAYEIVFSVWFQPIPILEIKLNDRIKLNDIKILPRHVAKLNENNNLRTSVLLPNMSKQQYKTLYAVIKVHKVWNKCKILIIPVHLPSVSRTNDEKDIRAKISY